MTSINSWLDYFRFSMEVQQVIALRIMRLGQFDARAAREFTSMFAEKAAAMTEAQVAAATALLTGRSPEVVMKRAATPYRRRVRANRKRLRK